MVNLDELLNLASAAKNSLLSEEQLLSFVKEAAVRAYKAGSDSRKNEDVQAEYDAQAKELRLVVLPAGEVAPFRVADGDTYKAIKAAVNALQKQLAFARQKENTLFLRAKFAECKQTCLPAKVLAVRPREVLLSVSNVEAVLPKEEQLEGESYHLGDELIVYIKDLKENDGTAEIVVSRVHAALVSYVMRRAVPEVDVGLIEIKKVARLAGKRCRIAVFSQDFGPAERCQKRASKVSQELGGESVEFIEWYPEIKAYIASALNVEARAVHIDEAERKARVEVLADAAETALDHDGESLALAEELTAYKIEITLVARDGSANLPGV
jgi:transcription antitermination factor NusA-like protein